MHLNCCVNKCDTLFSLLIPSQPQVGCVMSWLKTGAGGFSSSSGWQLYYNQSFGGGHDDDDVEVEHAWSFSACFLCWKSAISFLPGDMVS